MDQRYLRIATPPASSRIGPAALEVGGAAFRLEAKNKYRVMRTEG